ncbi:hypothetical protein DL98DRAFT_533159 [Cadophora sp. DSE1049]|nr:hypothetical protein DL98DRAFT_533159 [Cadophora sp. DSE1049]
MAILHDFVHKDKRRLLVEFTNPQYLQEQYSASGPSTSPHKVSHSDSSRSAHSPKSSRPLNREKSACEKSLDDDHYIRINARWLHDIDASESIRPGHIKDRHKHPRPRRSPNLFERNRLRLQVLAANQLQGGLSHSQSRPMPRTTTATVVFPDVDLPVKAASVKRRKGLDDLRATAAAHEAAAFEAAAEEADAWAADEFRRLAEFEWRNFQRSERDQGLSEP